MRALLCSGQGRIAGGMFDLYLDRPEFGTIRAAASDLLRRDLVDLLRYGTADEWTLDRASQIICVSRALAAAAALSPVGPTMVAGYSVGEMAAWGIAGYWDAGQTLALTAHRAELMDEADGNGDGGLGFIRGFDAATAERLVASHGCAIAIRNPGRLFIIGGLRDDVARCCAAALAAGATSARPIAVHVASHTPRLAAAVAPFAQALAAADTRRPSLGITLIGAADAAPVRSAETGLPGLANQLATTVNWAAVLEALVERGARRMLETGPGTALAEMVRSNFPEVEVRAVDDFRTVEGVKRWFDGT